MNSGARRVVIVGGGVIGMMSAFALVRRGHQVVVIDPTPGEGASYAAAGMVAPSAEVSIEHPELGDIAVTCLHDWPQLLDELSDYFPEPLALSTCGTLFVAYNASDRRELDRYLELAREGGHHFEHVSRVERPALFDRLTPRISEGFFAPTDGFVDPDAVMKALRLATTSLGVEFVRDDAVSTDTNVDGIAVVCASGDRVSGDVGLVATGYSSHPLTVSTLFPPHVRPIRGITVRLVSNHHAPSMTRGIVDGQWIYIVRRSQHSVLIGASSDESKDDVVEAGSLRRVLDDALRLDPSLEEASFDEVRVGLRPATSDHAPFFEVDSDGRWAWSSGHYRHGFLMAPDASRRAVTFVEGDA